MTTVSVLCSTPSSISSPLSPFPPKLPNSTSPPSLHHQTNLSPNPQLRSTIPPPQSPSQPSKLVISRRYTALSLSIAALFPLTWLTPPDAPAFDFGISGPKEWLKEQKKKSIKYILAPIVASREILTYAQQKLVKESSFEQKDMDEIRGMLNSAARDCVSGDRSSLVAFQARTGVEVCTFKLLMSNASSLLNDNDPSKLEAEARLEDLIRSFTNLNDLVKEADIQLVLDRQKIADALVDTLSSLDKFELGIKGCIEI